MDSADGMGDGARRALPVDLRSPPGIAPRIAQRVAMNRPGAPRILHVGKVYPPHVGGIESQLHALCTELIKWLGRPVMLADNSRRRAVGVRHSAGVTPLGLVVTS